MIEYWLLQPTIVEEPPLNHTQGGDAAEYVAIVVPKHGYFLVMKPIGGSIRDAFIDSTCRHIYGDVYEWSRAPRL